MCDKLRSPQIQRHRSSMTKTAMYLNPRSPSGQGHVASRGGSRAVGAGGSGRRPPPTAARIGTSHTVGSRALIVCRLRSMAAGAGVPGDCSGSPETAAGHRRLQLVTRHCSWSPETTAGHRRLQLVTGDCSGSPETAAGHRRLQLVTGDCSWSPETAAGHRRLQLVTGDYSWSPETAAGHRRLQLVTGDHSCSPETAAGHRRLQLVTGDCSWSPETAAGHRRPQLVTGDCSWSPETAAGHRRLQLVTGDCSWSPETAAGHRRPQLVTGDCPETAAGHRRLQLVTGHRKVMIGELVTSSVIDDQLCLYQRLSGAESRPRATGYWRQAADQVDCDCSDNSAGSPATDNEPRSPPCWLDSRQFVCDATGVCWLFDRCLDYR